MEWIQQQEQIRGGPLNILVRSDSMSLVQVLKSNNWKYGDTWLKQIKQVLYNLNSITTLLWISSHCDIPGNEQADELEKKGSMKNQENIPVTHSILKGKEIGTYPRKSKGNIWRETKSEDGNRKNLAKESKNTIFQTMHRTHNRIQSIQS